MNFCVEGIGYSYVFISLGYIPGVGIAGCYGVFMFRI
jgi:hypothetical protein